MTFGLSPRTRAITVLVLVFVAGAAASHAAALVWRRARFRATIESPDMGPVLDGLRLSLDQRRRAAAILSRSEPRAESILVETAGRLQEIADSVNDELRAILTPDQQRLLDSERRGPIFVVKRKGSNGSVTVDTVRTERTR